MKRKDDLKIPEPQLPYKEFVIYSRCSYHYQVYRWHIR